MDVSTRNTDDFSIVVEEYLFGHKGGMGPISMTETLSSRDVVFLYNIIETFQGAIQWEEGREALSLYFLPSGKCAVTAVFPDSDLSGRSTVFGHTLILSDKDFAAIGNNAFFLLESGCFHKKKDLPEKLDRRTIRLSKSSVKKSCEEGIRNRPKGFDDVFTAALSGRMVILATRVPANRLVKAIVCCLPPAARSSFTFSTLEVNLAAQGAARSGENQVEKRAVQFAAVSKDKAYAVPALEGADSYVLEDGRLTRKYGTVEGKERKNEFVETVLYLLDKGEDLAALYEAIEADCGKRKMSQEEYANELNFKSEYGDSVFNSEELSRMKSQFFGRDPKKFFHICLRSFEGSKNPGEWPNFYGMIHDVSTRLDTDDSWPHVSGMYRRKLLQSFEFLKFLVSRAGVHDPKFGALFRKEIAPAIVEEVQRLLQGEEKGWSDLAKVVSEIIRSGAVNHRQAKGLLVSAFSRAASVRQADAASDLVDAAARVFEEAGPEFLKELQEAMPTLARETVAEIVLRRMLLVCQSYRSASEKIESILGLVERCGGVLSEEQLKRVSAFMPPLLAENENPQLLRRVLLTYKEGPFGNCAGDLGNILKQLHGFLAALQVLDVFGPEQSLVIAKKRNKIPPNERSIFLKYIESASDKYNRQGISIPWEFKRWVQTFKLRTICHEFDSRYQRILRDNFDVECRKPKPVDVGWDLPRRRRRRRISLKLVFLYSFIAVVCSASVYYYYSDFRNPDVAITGGGGKTEKNYPSNPETPYRTLASDGTKQRYPLSPGDRPGTLIVTTDPDGAEIKVMDIGPPYKEGMELLPGSYRIQVSKQGFETKEVNVKIEGGVHNRPGVIVLDRRRRHAPQEGQLVIHTSPSKARVILDGKDVGETPYEGYIPEGDHTVVLKLQKYPDKVLKNVNVIKNKSNTINYDFNKETHLRENVKKKEEAATQFSQREREPILEEPPVIANSPKPERGQENAKTGQKTTAPKLGPHDTTLSRKPREAQQAFYLFVTDKSRSKRISLAGERTTRELTKEDYAVLFKSGVGNGAEITLLTGPNLDGKDAKPAGEPITIIYGALNLRKNGIEYRPWAEDGVNIAWEYSERNLPIDELLMILNGMRLPVQIDKNDIKIDLLKDERLKHLAGADKTIEYHLEGRREGRVAFTSEIDKIRIRSAELEIFRGEDFICKLPGKRICFEIRGPDYDKLWERGINHSDQIVMRMDGVDKKASISYGTCELKLDIDRGRKKLVIGGKVSTYTQQDKLFLKVGIKNETTPFTSDDRDYTEVKSEKIELKRNTNEQMLGTLDSPIIVTVALFKTRAGQKVPFFSVTRQVKSPG